MDQTVVMQEEWEKNCKRNKHEALRRCSLTSQSSQKGLSAMETVRDDDNESPMTTDVSPRYGVSSVCGRRREMEDAVAIHPSFSEYSQHYFGVYDGHGCSHVRTTSISLFYCFPYF